MNKTLSILLAAALLGGCANIPMGHSAPVHYWRVDTPASTFVSSDTAAKSNASVLLKVGVSELLKNGRMASMEGPNEVVYAESQRWAEPMEVGAARVLRETLASHYARVEATPVNVVFKPDFRVEVSIDEAWPSKNGEVKLAARWWISDTEGKLLKSGEAEFVQKGWSTGDWRGYSVRVGKLLADLAQSIDKDLSSLDAEKKN